LGAKDNDGRTPLDVIDDVAMPKVERLSGAEAKLKQTRAFVEQRLEFLLAGERRALMESAELAVVEVQEDKNERIKVRKRRSAIGTACADSCPLPRFIHSP